MRNYEIRERTKLTEKCIGIGIGIYLRTKRCVWSILEVPTYLLVFTYIYIYLCLSVRKECVLCCETKDYIYGTGTALAQGVSFEPHQLPKKPYPTYDLAS